MTTTDNLPKDVIKRFDEKFGDRRTFLTESRYYFNNEFSDEVKLFIAQELSQAQKAGEERMLKMNEAAFNKALKTFRKLRLVDYESLMDDAPPSETIISVLKSGLGGHYSDEAVKYIYEKAIRYYLKSLTPTTAEEAK